MMKRFFIFFIFFSLLLLFAPHTNVWAHEGNDYSLTSQSLDEKVAEWSYISVVCASILLLFLSGISLAFKKIKNSIKELLFLSIVLVTMITTLFLAGSTIYLNVVSSSGGPVHWHADTEIWACGRQLNLKDPKGFSNKIGTSTLHEHNDKRMHVEGVVVTPTDVSLAKFFHVIGGSLTEKAIKIPTNDGVVNFTNGDVCPDASVGEVQVFVYKTMHNGDVSQTKLSGKNVAGYVLSSQSNIPPGDCIIIEFATPKDKTTKICKSYEVALKTNKIRMK